MATNILVALCFLTVIIGYFFGYSCGKHAGAQEMLRDVASKLRRHVQDAFVNPWREEFNNRFMRTSKGSAGEYTVDESLLSFCLGLAQRLHGVAKLFPDDGTLQRYKAYSLRGYSLSEYITNCGADLIGFPDQRIDPYFGSPTGYVDAFLQILRETEGVCPDKVWMDKETFDITLDPRDNREYEELTLQVEA